jgi:hypothetical protein
MAIAAKARKAPVTVGREDVPERAPERTPTRDPNVIYNRLGEPIEMGRILTQDDDKFNLAKMGVAAPEGWTYEWRTRTVKGWEHIEAQVEDAQKGWTPVPADRHDGKIMPKGFKGAIERGGLMLMERPAKVTAMARQYDKRKANEQLQISHSMAGLMQRAAPNSGAILDGNALEAQRGTFTRRVAEPENSGYVTGRNYQYNLDE